jgi:predicted ArsR family transcriptional regulator
MTTDLKSIYLYVFAEFAVHTTDVAEHFGISASAARNALGKLDAAGLVGAEAVNEEPGIGRGRKANGQTAKSVWQTCEISTDNATNAQAAAYFDERMGQAPTTVAQAAKPAKAKAAQLAPDTKIQAVDGMGKRGACAARFEAYSGATTVGEFLALGGTRADLRWDLAHGIFKLVP